MKLKTSKIIVLGLICSLYSTSICSINIPSQSAMSDVDDSKKGEETICDVRIYEGNLYVNLRKKNEPENSLYMLVLITESGQRELIEFKQGHKNNINQFVGYSFIHNNVPTEIVYYELIEVRQETKILKTWSVCDGEVRFDDLPYDLAEEIIK